MISGVQQHYKPRVLVVGCGDVGMRLLPLLRKQFRVFAMTSQEQRHAELRAAGAIPITANLDEPQSLARFAGLARTVVHLAPPKSEGESDQRMRNLLAVLPSHCRLVYVSTTGVYGDCAGALFDETRPVKPNNPRAKRRVVAEKLLRNWAVRTHSCVSILRVPGIYAANRLPIDRLKKSTPALHAAEDVFTNHIHAEDLATIIRLAIFRGAPNRLYHAVDDSNMKMADYFDAVADAYGLARPPRLSRSELVSQVSPMLLSFMSESRRLDNTRLKAELGVRLRFSTVHEGIQAALNIKTYASHTST